jgi:hypothetical protein
MKQNKQEKSDIEKFLASLKKKSGGRVLTDKQIETAKRDINKKMEAFRIEHNMYMQRSREHASHTYVD